MSNLPSFRAFFTVDDGDTLTKEYHGLASPQQVIEAVRRLHTGKRVKIKKVRAIRKVVPPEKREIHVQRSIAAEN